MASDIVVVEAVAPSTGLPPQSATAWGAVLAGASVAVAVNLTLGLAAAGLGYSISTPGFASKAALGAFTPEVGAGAILVQVIAFGLGGYVAGRLRTTWIGVHSHEQHFRDTAYGLVAWAIGTVACVLLAAWVLAPYAEQMAAAATAAAPPLTADEAQRAANVAAQSSLFMAIGLFLSAFVAAVAARIGGMEHEAMYLRARSV
jgi:hypothetical protein